MKPDAKRQAMLLARSAPIIGYEDLATIHADGSLSVQPLRVIYIDRHGIERSLARAHQDALHHGTGMVIHKASAVGVSTEHVPYKDMIVKARARGWSAWRDLMATLGWHEAWGTTWDEARDKDAKPYVIDQPLLEIMMRHGRLTTMDMPLFADNYVYLRPAPGAGFDSPAAMHALGDWAIRYARMRLAVWRKVGTMPVKVYPGLEPGEPTIIYVPPAPEKLK